MVAGSRFLFWQLSTPFKKHNQSVTFWYLDLEEETLLKAEGGDGCVCEEYIHNESSIMHRGETSRVSYISVWHGCPPADASSRTVIDFNEEREINLTLSESTKKAFPESIQGKGKLIQISTTRRVHRCVHGSTVQYLITVFVFSWSNRSSCFQAAEHMLQQGLTSFLDD